jgi:hypothetical protein
MLMAAVGAEKRVAYRRYLPPDCKNIEKMTHFLGLGRRRGAIP